MSTVDPLDELSGTHVPDPEILEKLNATELRFLKKLSVDFSLEPLWYMRIARALYQFKQVLRRYSALWFEGISTLPHAEQTLARQIFEQIHANIDRDARSSFSKENFFGRLRFLLYACKQLAVPTKHQRTYLGWVLSFPIVPAKSIREVLQHELYPAILPHVYMYRVAGFVRDKLADGKDHKHIGSDYRKFLKELNISKAHAKWFRGRLSGSYGSRQ